LPDIDNVELMNPTKFAELIGYKGEFQNAFFEVIGLAKESIYDMNARLILRKKAKTKFMKIPLLAFSHLYKDVILIFRMI